MSFTPTQEPQSSVKKRLIDRVCPPKVLEIVPETEVYQEMLGFERRLDSDISKKTLDIQESMRKPSRVKKTLKIFLTNLFYTHHDGSPSWELRIEGRLTDDPRPKRKFSSFFKSLVIELDNEQYKPNDHLIEWHRTTLTSETDGFQVRRPGDKPVKCMILFQLEHQPPQFKIDPRLAKAIGMTTDTRPAIINAIWQYVKTKTLQDPEDREYILNDKDFKKIFECKRMKYTDIPSKLNSLLYPTEPIVIEHQIIRGVGETQRAIYELDVDFDNNVKDSSVTSMMSNANIQGIQQLDEKICDTLEAIKLTRNTFDLFTSFAEDPHQFTNQWLASQSSDLKLTSSTNDNNGTTTSNGTSNTDTSVSNGTSQAESEEERRADYYYQPWIQEAVCRYFYRKVQERRGDLEVL